MKYQEVTNYACDAQESDWLSVTYTQRNYIKEEKEMIAKKIPSSRQKGVATWLKRNYKYIIAGAFLILALTGMLFVEIEGGVFQTARLAYTSVLLEDVGNMGTSATVRKMELPATQTVAEIKTDGTVVLTGGKVAQSLQSGTVTTITDTTVTVKTDENLSIVYGGLTDILVAENSLVAAFDCIGRYSETMTVNLVYNGFVVQTISSGGYSLEWQA